MGMLLVMALLAAAAPADSGRAAVQAAAAEQLAAQFPAEAARLEVRVVRLSGGADTVQAPRLRFVGLRGAPAGHLQAEVYAAEARAGAALLYVARFDSVAALGRALAPGEAPAEADLAAVWIETTRLPAGLLGRREALEAVRAGAVAARRLAEGRLLKTGDLRLPDDTAAGAAVRMRFEQAGMSVQIPCTAREAGRAGEIIRVYSSATRAVYRARLTGEGEAEWVSTL